MNIQEIDKKLEALKRIAENKSGRITPEIANEATTKIAMLETKKAELLAAGENGAEDTPAPVIDLPVERPNKEGLRAEILLTLKQLMDMNPNSGVDSEAVQELIQQYLNQTGIRLNQLNQEVLDEIKRNQTVVLEIPSYGLQISMSKSNSKIPNIYSILDDVLSGNNVWLIGDAGGGKTYTAEKVAEILKREFLIINCSQYTSPQEIIGGQTIEGYKDGKLIVAWRDGKILIADEMSKLDSNTAGLFNDALAKSTKTRPGRDAKIGTANPEEAPIPRSDKFGFIATSNIWPNRPPQGGYIGNNQQDLSLLDRFAGSSYQVEYTEFIDQESARYKFIYDFLVGDYYRYREDVKANRNPTSVKGLRTVVDRNNYKNLALVSYRTVTAFRVAFEIELVRAMQKKAGQKVLEFGGKTVKQTFENYLVAFPEDAKQSIYREVMTPEALELKTKQIIYDIINGDSNEFKKQLTPDVAAIAADILETTKSWTISENFDIKGE